MLEEKKSSIKNNYNTKTSYLDVANNLTFFNHIEHSDLYNNLSNKYIKSELEYFEIEQNLKNFYHSLHEINSDIKHQKDYDILCFRIAYMLGDKSFVLNPVVFKNIHSFLYKDIFDFSGNFREYNISQKESLSNHYPINFIDYKDIDKSLIYVFDKELSYDYSTSSQNDMIRNFANFFSSIWEIHPFVEGNTCTISIFMIKYLVHLGFNLNLSAFSDNSSVFKNGLIRSVYNNFPMDIYANFDLLISFLESLLNLHSNDSNSNKIEVNSTIPKLSVKVSK